MRTVVPLTLLSGASDKAGLDPSVPGLPEIFTLDSSCTSTSTPGMSSRAARASDYPSPLPCPADLRDMLRSAGGPPARTASRDEALRAAAQMRATLSQPAPSAAAACPPASPVAEFGINMPI